MADFKIEGIDKVLAQMRNASVQMRQRVARAGVRKGANVVRDAARAGWRQVDREGTPNKIHENVAVQFDGRTFKRTGDIKFRVGIRGGARSYANTASNRRQQRVGKQYDTGGTTFYWRFLELGTSRIPARPVMQPALFNSGSAVIDAMATEIGRQFDKLARKGIA